MSANVLGRNSWAQDVLGAIEGMEGAVPAAREAAPSAATVGGGAGAGSASTPD